MQYLILGANGYIGSYLYRQMRRDGLRVIGTGHFRKGIENLVGFDALNDSVYDVTKLVTDKEKTAIFCIAQPNIDRCKVEYELSRQINVVHTRRIMEGLIQENFHVIYFSTDNVFDGIKGSYTEEDKTNAVNQYGKMKESIEKFLAKKYPEVCIFRLPKVLGEEREKQNMLTDLENRLSDKEVKCIRGTRMSIVAREDIYRACLIASKKKMHGMYNLSNGEVYSRKELAVEFFKSIGIYNKNIVELDLDEFGFMDMRPLNISLDNSKFREETGYHFLPLHMMIKQYFSVNGVPCYD